MGSHNAHTYIWQLSYTLLPIEVGLPPIYGNVYDCRRIPLELT